MAAPAAAATRGKDGKVRKCRLGADYGHRAVTCQIGGGVMLRHHGVRDSVHGWLTGLGRGASTEQHAARRGTPDKDAILDAVHSDK